MARDRDDGRRKHSLMICKRSDRASQFRRPLIGSVCLLYTWSGCLQSQSLIGHPTRLHSSPEAHQIHLWQATQALHIVDTVCDSQDT